MAAGVDRDARRAGRSARVPRAVPAAVRVRRRWGGLCPRCRSARGGLRVRWEIRRHDTYPLALASPAPVGLREKHHVPLSLCAAATLRIDSLHPFAYTPRFLSTRPIGPETCDEG